MTPRAKDIHPRVNPWVSALRAALNKSILTANVLIDKGDDEPGDDEPGEAGDVVHAVKLHI
jgi:hypothetical protein